MRTPPQSQQQDIDVFALWRGLKSSLRGLLTLTLAVTLLTFGALSMLTPQYTSEAQLTIVAKPTKPLSDAMAASEVKDGLVPRLDRAAINTHVNALKAPDLLLRAAEKLKLSSRAEFGAAGDAGLIDQVLRTVGLGRPKSDGSREETMLRVIQQRLQVSAVPGSRFISIRFASADPRLAAEFANQLVETYRESLVENFVSEARQLAEALGLKTEQLTRELLQAEADIERVQAGTVQAQTDKLASQADSQRRADLNAQLVKAEADRSQAQSKWEAAVELSRTGNVDALPGLENVKAMRGLIKQRVRIERQITEARAALSPTHPRIKQLNSDLAEVKASIRRHVQKIIRGLEKTFRTAAFRVDDIKAEISSLPVKAPDPLVDNARLKSLERVANAKRAALEQAQRQLEDSRTQVLTKAVPEDAQVVSMARPAATPSFPKKVPYTLLAMVATFILGLAVLTAKEIIVAGRAAQQAGPDNAALDTGELTAGMAGRFLDQYGQSEQVQSELEMPPASEELELEDEDPSMLDDDVTIQGIVEHLIQRGEEVAGFRTIVVGETHGMDVSHEGMQLARHLSEADLQVVVIDCNTDNESFSDSIGLARRPGITELLVGAATFEDVITHIPNTRVHHIGLGYGSNAEDFYFDGDDLNAVLDALDDVYDQILVVGRYLTAQALFEAIEGRFDAGISVSDARLQRSIVEGTDDTFLGFEVTDIDIIRYERSEPTAFATRRQQLSGSKFELV